VKKHNQQLIRGISIVLLLMAFIEVNATQRRYAPLATTALSDYVFTIENEAQVSDRILEFDLYLLDTDPSQVFELGLIQAGIIVNPLIYNGGTITVTRNVGSSQMVPTNVPPNVVWRQDQNAIKLVPNAGGTIPGAGTIISTVAPGTRLCRLRITNTVAFSSGVKANLMHNFTTVPYPTSVSMFQGTINVMLVSDVTNCYSNAANIALNTIPTVFVVNGGGSYCQNNGGLPVDLLNSETGVSYQLYKDAVALGTAINGTGSAISFGNQLAGTYTVKGIRFGISADMTGSVIISEDPTIIADVTIDPSSNPVVKGIPVIFTPVPVGGGTSPTYQWYKNSLPVATTDTYSYLPVDGDQVYAVMTSSDTSPCLTGSQAQSNTITMSVSQGTNIGNNGDIKIDIYAFDKNIFVSCSEKANQVYIYNALGSLIKLENNIFGLKKINMNDYAETYYFVKIVTGNKVYSEKVLLK